MPRGKKSQKAGESENASANAGHNASARRQVILDICSELASLEARRKEISEEIAALKQTRIKGDLAMKIADFNAAYRLSKLENEARDQFIDTLRETFTALGIGEQLDWLGNSDYQSDPESVARAAELGSDAGRRGKQKDNPYLGGSAEHAAWSGHYDAAQAKNLETLGTGAAANLG